MIGQNEINRSSKCYKVISGLNVLDNVSFSINSGESLAIVGPSGVGKSTLLRIITGLEALDSGKVIVNAKKISMVFQYSALLNSYRVSENVALALHDLKLSKKEKQDIVQEKLRLVGLEKYLNHFPDELSGGQRKRVAFARAVANDPEIILYDEPTSGLDPILSTLIEDYMNKLAREQQVTSIIVTHQLSTIQRTANHVLMLYKGKIVWDGKPVEFIKTENPYVRQFVGAQVEGPILAGLLE